MTSDTWYPQDGDTAVYTRSAGSSRGNIPRTVQLRDTIGTHVRDSSVSRLLFSRKRTTGPNNLSLVPSISIHPSIHPLLAPSPFLLSMPTPHRVDPPAIGVTVVIAKTLLYNSNTLHLPRPRDFAFNHAAHHAERAFTTPHSSHMNTMKRRQPTSRALQRAQNHQKETKLELHLVVLR